VSTSLLGGDPVNVNVISAEDIVLAKLEAQAARVGIADLLLRLWNR
jgi:hypothetical protein